MFKISFLVFLACLFSLLFVSERLFRIYSMGRQMYFNFIFKGRMLKAGKGNNLSERYKRFVFMLWMLEIVLAVLTMLSGVIAMTI